MLTLLSLFPLLWEMVEAVLLLVLALSKELKEENHNQHVAVFDFGVGRSHTEGERGQRRTDCLP